MLLAPAPLLLMPQRCCFFATGLLLLLVVDVVIRDAAPVLALVGGDGLVFVVVVGFRVEGDDVPGVEEAGDVAEGAKEDVDEAVGGADAGFDPDGYGGEEDGEEAEEDVAAAHFFVFLLFSRSMGETGRSGRWMLAGRFDCSRRSVRQSETIE